MSAIDAFWTPREHEELGGEEFRPRKIHRLTAPVQYQ